MANGPTLSKAIRGRSMVRRDYSAGDKLATMERKADFAATQAALGMAQSTLGLVQGIAGGVSAVASGIESNIETHADVGRGAKRMHESALKSGALAEGTEFTSPTAEMSWLDRWTTQASPSEGYDIGGRTFTGAELRTVGGLEGEAGVQALRAFDKESKTYKSLHESYGMSLSEAVSPQGGSDDLSQYGAKQMREVATETPATIETKETKTAETSTGEITQTADPTTVLPGEGQSAYNRRLEGLGFDPEDLAAEAYMKFLKEEGGSSLQLGKRRSTFEEKYPQFKK